MTSKILIIADASLEALELVLDALQTIQKHQPSIKIVFVSSLSRISLKNLGPNILDLLLKEEKETSQGAQDYFARVDIPHQLKIIAAPHWEAIFDEIRKGDQDLIILQGEFLNICRKNSSYWGSCLRKGFGLRCPILAIDEPEDALLSKGRAIKRDSEVSEEVGSSKHHAGQTVTQGKTGER